MADNSRPSSIVTSMQQTCASEVRLLEVAYQVIRILARPGPGFTP